MASSSITFSLPQDVRVLGLSAEPGRAVFIYENGSRTDQQRRSESGRPLFKHKVLVQLAPTSDAEEAALLLDSEDPLGVLTQLALDSATKITVRPADQYALALSISGSLAKKAG